MMQTMDSRATSDSIRPPRELCLKAFHSMLLSRVLDEKFAALYRGGKIHGGVFLGKGQEAVSASLGVSLKKGDILAPLIRDGAGRLAFGETIMDAVRTYLGSSLGPMRGRDGNVHRGRPDEGILPMISHLGAMPSVVNGMLIARRFKKISDTVGAACLGDGATSTGAFHEAMNQAAIEKLPLVMVITNNHFAYSTPNSRQFACADLVDKAVGYGIDGHSVDGTSLPVCLDVISRAVTRAREGKGPQMVVATLLRLCGHGEHDDAQYIDSSLKASAVGRDCLPVAEDYIIQQGWADAKDIKIWRKDASLKVEEAVAAVQQEPAPDPYEEDWTTLATRRLNEGLQTV
jgi:pyruvate dehydrogenase E1 component alpha subunit/2-oxoisovalerate dehydrogenase E1 component alpha subunit